MASAAQIISSEFKEHFRRDIRGGSGRREYMIRGLAAIEEALNPSLAIPIDGAPWSSAYPNLVCTGLDIDWFAPPRDGESLGIAKAVATYGPPESAVLDNSQPSPRGPGEVWSEVKPQTQSQLQMYAYMPGTTNLIDVPINNGQGVNVSVGVLSIKVSKTLAPSSSPNLGAYLNLMSPAKLNAEAISIPPPWGSGGPLNFGARQLLFQSFEITRINSLVVVTTEMLAAENWDVVWQAEDDDGAPVARYIGQIYETASFQGLW